MQKRLDSAWMEEKFSEADSLKVWHTFALLAWKYKGFVPSSWNIESFLCGLASYQPSWEALGLDLAFLFQPQSCFFLTKSFCKWGSCASGILQLLFVPWQGDQWREGQTLCWSRAELLPQNPQVCNYVLSWRESLRLRGSQEWLTVGQGFLTRLH